MALLADLLRPEQRSKGMAAIGISIGGAYLVSLAAGAGAGGLADRAGHFSDDRRAGAGHDRPAVVAGADTGGVAAGQPAERGSCAAALTDPHLLRLDFSIMALHMLMTGTFVVLPPLLRDSLAPAGGAAPVAVSADGAAVDRGHGAADRLRRAARAAEAGVRRHGRPARPAALLVLLEGSHALCGVAAGLLAFLIAFNVLEATLPSMMSRLAPMAGRGTAMGVYSTAQFLGAFIGGAGAGWLRGHHGAQGVLLAGSRAVRGVVGRVGWPAARRRTCKRVLIDVADISPERARALTDELTALAGVAEAVVIPEEGVAYLRVDGQRFEPASLERFSAA